MKNVFREFAESRAWKNETDPLSRKQLIRRQQFGVDAPGPEDAEDGNVPGDLWGQEPTLAKPSTGSNAAAPLVGSIQARRKTLQLKQFFMTQLPDSMEGTAEYDQEPAEDSGGAQKPNLGINAQQVLLRLVSTETYLKKILHGSCTIMRADLEW